MNTIRSTWIGWGVLIIAGTGSYVVAKRNINADKRARHERDMQRRRLNESLEEDWRAMQQQPSHRKDHHKERDYAGSPSGEASHDPAPTSHPSGGDEVGRSKYEPTEVYRSKKGDRFSSIGGKG